MFTTDLHNNALGEGGNPFEHNGYGIYYFQPFSLNLAREIHQAYSEAFGVKSGTITVLNDDGLHYASFVLTRAPQFSSVLIESAYLMIPREEVLLNTKKFQCDCAEAIVRGLKKYAINMRTVIPVLKQRKK